MHKVNNRVARLSGRLNSNEDGKCQIMPDESKCENEANK